MGRTSQWVQVGRRQLELSNLEKVIDGTAGLVKAQLIRFYHQIAPTLLRHARGRPLTLVRMPDGVQGERFYQKRMPSWAPEWMGQTQVGDIDYAIADEVADIVWLANLACLELHVMQVRAPDVAHPDQIVFDLDPPEGHSFRETTDLAVDLSDVLRDRGYHPFVKTTGQKGLHVVVPVEPMYEVVAVMEAARDIGSTVVRRNKARATLRWSKSARQDRILVDLNRNAAGQTAVAAYSVRGRPGLPVSTPVRWEELIDGLDPSDMTMEAVLSRIVTDGDPWEGMAAYAVPLHTDRTQGPVGVESGRLAPYADKRNFEVTTEPAVSSESTSGSRFVVHRHHASRLHYDLRLEESGVLRSWALPRGLPHRPGVRRLAVEVEPHPVEYLSFEGDIPRGEYGAGSMWVFARGRYAVTKRKKDGFYFRLEAEGLSADYRMHRTEERQWLIERVDDPQDDWLGRPVAPMLCTRREDVPPEADHVFEVKWDGIRVLVSLDEQEVRIWSRNGNEITDRFPELIRPDGLRATTGLFDGEIVCLDDDGKPEFGRVIRRLHGGGSERSDPAVCYLFDCLYLDGRVIVREPLERRRAWLEDAVRSDTPFRISRQVDDGHLLFRAAREQGLEGVVAKRRGSRYRPGARSDAWVKVKSAHRATCQILGFTEGEGARSGRVGSLLLGESRGKTVLYRGRVGSGFTDRDLSALSDLLATWPRAGRPEGLGDALPDRAEWLLPGLVCDVAYTSITGSGTFRAAEFVRLRPDLTTTP